MAHVIDVSVPNDGQAHLLVTAGATGANIRVDGGLHYIGGSDMSPTSHRYALTTGDTPLILGPNETLYGLNATTDSSATVSILVTAGSAT